MNKIYANLNIIGSDETGVGDYLTPLVAAAVYVPKENALKLEKMGVKDSKTLTDNKILELFEKIKPLIKSSIRIMNQAQYNFLTNKNFNAHELKTLLHVKALNAVESRIEQSDLIIIDQYASENNFNKYVTHLKITEELMPLKTKIKFVEKGENEHVAVAAASIVARAYFLNEMQKQNQTWNFIFPFGTNAIVEEAARNFVKINGKEALYKVAKISFKTTQKIF